MSVLGLDIGNANSVIAVAQRGGVDIVANETSNRSTPSLVAYGEKQRFVGEGAAVQQLTNLQNTIGNIKNLLGVRWQDPYFQSMLPFLGFYSVVQLPNGFVGVQVSYKGKTHVFTPEQVLAALLVTLKNITEKDVGAKCYDVVISVPFYYNVFQRQAVLDATKIAGLNALRLINDHLASAVNYGLYKIDITDKHPRRVMIVDLGYSGIQVAIVEFKKSEARVLSCGYAQGISGCGIDMALSNYVADEFQAKHKIDLRKYPKSWFRVQVAASKLKRTINLSPTAPFYCECIYEELDLNVMLSQDKYKEIITPLIEHIPPVIQTCLDRVGMKPQDLHSIELIGSCSRIQPIQKYISSYLGRGLSFTMNAEEGVAKGCALQCAILSPKFRVREYKLLDISNSSIEVGWSDVDDDGNVEDRCVEVFPVNSVYPSSKWINFLRPQSNSLSIKIRYKEAASDGLDPTIATVNVLNIPTTNSNNDTSVRIKIYLDIHGMIRIEGVDLVEKVEVDPPCPAPPVPQNASAADQQAALETKAAPPQAEPAAADGPAAEEPNKHASPPNAEDAPAANNNNNHKPPANSHPGEKPADPQPNLTGSTDTLHADIFTNSNSSGPSEKKKKVKYRYKPIPFEVHNTCGLDDSTISSYREIENKTLQETLEIIQLAEAKNAVEGYVYDALNKLDGVWREFVTPEDYMQFKQKLQEIADWLYDEGENQPKQVYDNYLAQLHSTGDTIAHRYYESENFEHYYSKYNLVVKECYEKATAPLEAYSHIPAEEKAKILAEIENQHNWLNNMLKRRAELKKTDDPVLLTSDMQAKANALKQLADSILSKPKPVQKETPKEDAKPASPNNPPQPPAPENAPSPQPKVEDGKMETDDVKASPEFQKIEQPPELPMEVDSSS